MKNENEMSSNRLLLPLLFILSTIVLDMVSFIYLGVATNNGALQIFPTQAFFNIGGAIVCAGIIYVVKNPKASLSIFYILILFQIVINILNANIYHIFGDVFTMDYIFLGAEAAAAISWEFIDFVSIIIYAGIFGVIVFGTVALYKWNKTTFKVSKLSTSAFALILVLLVETCGITMFAQQTASVVNAESTTIENNTNYLWNSFRFKYETYREFGFYGFYAKNFYDFLQLGSGLDKKDEEELLKFAREGQQEKKETEFSKDNLIVVLCESHEWFAYDPIFTPTVWDLMTSGGEYDSSVFTNFYGHNKTNVSEQIVLSGNKPKLSSILSLFSSGTTYPYTLPKLFEKAHENESVQTTYFHSYKRSFYTRDPSYLDGGIGFDKFISMEDYKEQSKFFGDWISDADFIRTFAEDFVPTDVDNFLTCYATVSTHGPYSYENPRFNEYYSTFDENFEEYKAWVESQENYGYSIPENEKLFEEFRRYKADAMDFDNMVKAIFDRLEETNHLDDTTVVFYADHNCYYDDLGITVKGISSDDYSNIEAHRIPLIIYNSKLEAGVYDQFCNTYDIFPTICELYGFEYNKNLVQGYNLFSDEIKNSFFASHLGGMFNQNFFSKNISDAVPLNDLVTLEDLQNFKALAEQYFTKQQKFEDIYINNLI